MDEQHVFNHYDQAAPRINVKAEKNSKGFNYEATVTGAETVEQAMGLLRQAVQALESEYGKTAA